LYIEVKLLEKSPPASLEVINILDFMINVIRRFSRQILSAERTIGPGCVQRPPEAQFQDEFYRCCREYSKRGLLPFPEFGTAKGRVDFYIPARGWGVELLRDGDRLERHVGRFSDTGIYHTTLPLSDYIILDFRKTRPKRAHPGMCICYSLVIVRSFSFSATQTCRIYTTLYSMTVSEGYPFWTMRGGLFVKTLCCCHNCDHILIIQSCDNSRIGCGSTISGRLALM
jgi:hypothetical protein